MVALLAACPRAVGVIRPMCRMLGIALSDYVPEERVVHEISAAVLVAVAPAVPVQRIDTVQIVPTVPETMTGIAWIRFIPM
jgi:hypothetical protein